jgi:Domain of unknown function (DUF4386)
VSNQKLARLAGLLYVILLPTTGLWYGTWASIATEDPATALARLQASRTFFGMTLVAGAAGFVDFLILGLVFYRLFSPVARTAAGLILAFIVVDVPLSLAAVARQIDALSLLDWSHRLPGLSGDQLQLQVTLALHSADHLFLVTSIFSGLWILPLGWLGFRSRLFPRTLGVMLMLGGVFYVCTFVGTVFDPNYAKTLAGRVIGISCGIPGVAGELLTALWLLITGAGERQGGYNATVAAAHAAGSLSDL